MTAAWCKSGSVWRVRGGGVHPDENDSISLAPRLCARYQGQPLKNTPQHDKIFPESRFCFTEGFCLEARFVLTSCFGKAPEAQLRVSIETWYTICSISEPKFIANGYRCHHDSPPISKKIVSNEKSANIWAISLSRFVPGMTNRSWSNRSIQTASRTLIHLLPANKH